MTRNPAAETIVGQVVDEVYGWATIKMPDGTESKRLVQRAKTVDGRVIWEEVDPKIAAFNDRFKDTATVPADWRDPATGAVEQKAPGLTTVQNLKRMLILSLGDPKAILTAKALDDGRLRDFKASPSKLTLIHGIINTLNDPEWNAVAKFLPRPLYPI